MDSIAFDAFFCAATGHEPFDYQRRLAGGDHGRTAESLLINIPTGLGKTAAVVLAWLWNRVALPDQAKQCRWPRRLVYCLPMRTLVEQTRDNVAEWLARLAFAADADDPRVQAAVEDLAEKARKRLSADEGKLRQLKQDLLTAREGLIWLVEHSPVVLMGGEEIDARKAEWDIYPERPTILVGTQDMLLSRALNRGYAMSRYRWPVHFGLLNNDCLWVCDEVQLLGPGFETTLQLDLFRRHRWGSVGDTATWWMSATLAEGTDEFTVDRSDFVEAHGCGLMSERIRLVPADFADPDSDLPLRLAAKKVIDCRPQRPGAQEIVSQHQPDTLTLVVLNTVQSARSWHAEISGLGVDAVLLHSQYRPGDRPRIPDRGLIISTQVVEAGVDISAARLWTECAPTASLVQRLGRLNRYGEANPEGIAVIWKAEKCAPYEEPDVETGWLCANSGRPASEWPIKRQPQSVIRAPDVWELFDTDPDLHGGFTDISGYIRAADREMHVYVFWRDYEDGMIEAQAPPEREELCPAPFYEVRALLEKTKSHGLLLQQKDLRVWERVGPKQVRPGMTILLHRKVGGYDKKTGWTGRRGGDFEVFTGTGDGSHLWSDPNARGKSWENVDTHTEKVAEALEGLLGQFDMDQKWKAALIQAARWHDQGKAYERWQDAVLRIATPPHDEAGPWAKFVSSKQFRPGVRHECASALLARKKWTEQPELGLSALAVYLVAAHHGKVRMALRSIDDLEERSAFGVRETDGFDLECMEIGCIERDGHLEPSWGEMVLDLLGPCDPEIPSMPFREGNVTEVYGLGPFRLAWLETLLRAADWRGSQK